MSDPNTPDEGDRDQIQNAHKAPKQKPNLRLFLLVGLLLLAIAASLYDYKVARPSVLKSYEQVNEKANTSNSLATSQLMSSADVQEIVGKPPSRTYEEGDFTVEVYSWMAGLPFRSRDYFVVYRRDQSQLVLHTHFTFEIDEKVLAPKVVTGVEIAEDDEPEVAGAGGGEGGEQQGGGQQGGRGSFDPAAFFARQDADGDGKLAGDEISDRMQERLEAIDTDGDGAVSLEEMMARAGQRGGRGGGGRPQRPQLDPGQESPGGPPGDGLSEEEAIADPPTDAPSEDPPTDAPSEDAPSEDPPTDDPPTDDPPTDDPPTDDPPTDAPSEDPPTDAPSDDPPTDDQR